MLRKEIINDLIQKFQYKTYLEVGVADPNSNFNHIICDYKVSVDPRTDFNYTCCLPSDKFFEINREKFDIIFLDGLHVNEQIYRDIQNSLNILNENGTIVCHDMNPPDENHQIVPQMQGSWTGDCWKAWINFRKLRSDLFQMVVEDDFGVGIIRRGNQKQLPFNIVVNWANLNKNRKEWLNLVSANEFSSWLTQLG